MVRLRCFHSVLFSLCPSPVASRHVHVLAPLLSSRVLAFSLESVSRRTPVPISIRMVPARVAGPGIFHRSWIAGGNRMEGDQSVYPSSSCVFREHPARIVARSVSLWWRQNRYLSFYGPAAGYRVEHESSLFHTKGRLADSSSGRDRVCWLC